jgi:hypothetical protein
MKSVINRAMYAITRSEFSARVDAAHHEARTDVARKSAQGNAWRGIRENASLLGMRTDSTSRPKMRFGAGR